MSMLYSIKHLIALLVLVPLMQILGQDTIRYASLNGRADGTLINYTQSNTYSEFFIQQLFASKEAAMYQLYDTILVLDHKDTVHIPKVPLYQSTPYVSANICFHQRNYALAFTKLTLDSYSCTLDILTDHRIKSQMQFTIILQPSILIRNDNIVYKDRNSNLKIMVQSANTIVLENLFIENQPCPRTIMFVK